MITRIKYAGWLGMVAIAATFLVSCEKTFDNKHGIDDDQSNSSVVQFIVATVNATRNHVFLDGTRITGSNLVSGSVFPSSGFGVEIAGGLRAFLVRDTLGTSTQLPFSFAENMKAASHQTVFLYDTITSPKQKTVIDNIVVPSDTTARVRFASFAYLPTMQLPAFDIYSARRQANIFTNVRYTDVTEFVPIASGVADTFYIRETGTTTNLQNVTISTATPPAPPVWSDIRLIWTPTMKRSYTLVFRGSYRTTNLASTHVRSFTLFANY
jgi:hypothetical protein